MTLYSEKLIPTPLFSESLKEKSNKNLPDTELMELRKDDMDRVQHCVPIEPFKSNVGTSDLVYRNEKVQVVTLSKNEDGLDRLKD